MFAGFVNLGTSIQLLTQTQSNNSPAVPDAIPTYRVYGPAGVISNGTVTLLETGSITGVTNANPAVITSALSNVTTGTVVTIAGVTGATGVNGTHLATKIDANTFSVAVAAGGAYAGGGTWQSTGLYSISLDTGGAGFEAGVTYTVVVTYSISGTFFTNEITFTVC